MSDIFHLDIAEYLPFIRQTTIAGTNHVTVRNTISHDSLPATKQNGYLVTRDIQEPIPQLTFYQAETVSQARIQNGHRTHKRRLLSLPPSKPRDHAGLTTKALEDSNQRPQKFATAWANARAEHQDLIHSDIGTDQKANKDTKHSHVKTEPTVSDSTTRQTEKKVLVEKNNTSPPNKSKVAPEGEASTPPHKTDQVVLSPSHENKENNSPSETAPTVSDKSPDSPYTDYKARYRSRPRKVWDPSYVVSKPALKNRRNEESELTYHPELTDINKVYKAYTGRTRRQIRQGEEGPSGSQNGEVYHAELTVSPRNRKEYVLTLREANVYRNITSVYKNDGERRHRKAIILQKFMTVELEQIKLYNQRIREKQLRANESKRKQELQLYLVRKRFRDQQTQRFRSQYVTGRVLEHEKMNRKSFGLPEEQYSDEDEEIRSEEDHKGGNVETQEGSSEHEAKVKPKKDQPIKNYDREKKKKAFEKKYKHMFDIKTGPNWDPNSTTPKMEKIDVIDIETEEKEEDVPKYKTSKEDDAILKDAKMVLQSTTKELISTGNTSSRTSRRLSLDSSDDDDDDEDDIFERARRKYNLDVDSSSAY